MFKARKIETFSIIYKGVKIMRKTKNKSNQETPECKEWKYGLENYVRNMYFFEGSERCCREALLMQLTKILIVIKMVEFLDTNTTSSELKIYKKKLYLVSPYLQMSDKIKILIQQAKRNRLTLILKYCIVLARMEKSMIGTWISFYNN